MEKEMEIAVLADIHGNYVAFGQCMDYCIKRGIDTYIFLGDYAGELAYPEKTMEMLFEIAKKYYCYFVRGNKEDYWLDYRDRGETGWKEYDSTTGALFYTYHHLSQKSMEFYDTLPMMQKVKIGKFPKMTICHGSPHMTNEKMLPEKERTLEIMEQSDTDIILFGHTHNQQVMEHQGTFAMNPGAVGISPGGKVQFMILSDEMDSADEALCWKKVGESGMKYVFIQLSYDIERVICDLKESGLTEYAPGWCKVTEYLFRKGGIHHGQVLNRAMKLCREAKGECIWPNIPETYWQQAVEEMLV